MFLHNEEGVFQLRRASTCWYQFNKVLLDFGAQPLMLSKIIIDSLGLIDVDFDPCPYQILTSMGGLKKARWLTKQETVIKFNPNKSTYYTTLRAWAEVTHVTFYDVLVRGVVLYPLGVTIDFWEETTYYHPSWQTKTITKFHY